MHIPTIYTDYNTYKQIKIDNLVQKYLPKLSEDLIKEASNGSHKAFIDLDICDFITGYQKPQVICRNMIMNIESELKWSLLHYYVTENEDLFKLFDMMELLYAVWDTSFTVHFTWQLKRTK